MTFFLRIEAMNLGNFVYDTNDLATIRGGSLLLLEAMEEVEKLINQVSANTPNNAEKIEQLEKKLQSISHDKSLSKKQIKREKGVLRQQIKQLKAINNLGTSSSANHTISKGASWGLFDLGDIDHKKALEIKQQVIKLFKQPTENNKAYQYATFMVDVYPKPDTSYTKTRDTLQTLNRWQQLQSPSFSIVKEAINICQIDHLTPADKTTYNKDGDKIFIADSIKARREYGREVKKQADFYANRGAIAKEEGETLTLSSDLEKLSANPPEYARHLKGKIAFIYIDGNEFGKMQKASTNEIEQQQFDNQTRSGRDKVLKDIIQKIKTQEDWLNEKELRLETLLWGGDEIIWVVPAWQGWSLLNQFYQLAKEHIKLNSQSPQHKEPQELFHGSSIIFCHHNAPIHRIDQLARRLADNYSKKAEHKKQNKIAYQLLKSFDHVGSDLQTYRQDRIKGLTDNLDELLIDARNMEDIENCIRTLKDNDFPRRKIYQILQAYRNNEAEKAEQLYQKLIGAKEQNQQQKIYQNQLQILQAQFDLSESEAEKQTTQIHWLHLMELWDQLAIKEVA